MSAGPRPRRRAAAAAAEGDGAVAALRHEIEQVDRSLVQLIARRCELATAMGAAKRTAGLPVADLIRESAVLRQAAALARDEGVDEERVRHIFWCLIELSRKAQLEAAG